MRTCENCQREFANVQQIGRAGGIVCPYCQHEDSDGCHVLMVPEISARPSRVQGVGTGDKDLEIGLALLMEAQA